MLLKIVEKHIWKLSTEIPVQNYGSTTIQIIGSSVIHF
jgi:hypothetical protein